MQHPTPPPVEPLPAKPSFSLPPERRREINDKLELPRAGLAVAVNHPPGDRRAHLTIVKLPRGNAGKPPRRGVHTPMPAQMQKGNAQVSKHSRQQHRDGKFGKRGQATVERKADFLAETSETANLLAEQAKLNRQARERGGLAA